MCRGPHLGALLLAGFCGRGTVCACMPLSPSHLRLYMNLAAGFLLMVSVGSLVGVGVLTHLALSDDNSSVSLAAIWLAGVWAVLSMVAAAWCRLHALRADASTKNSPPLDDTDEVSATLLKGIEQWMSDEKVPTPPINSSSSTE